jgi:amidase
MTADSRLIDMTACDVVDLLQRQEVTPLDLLDTLEDRISDVDPTVNALPTLCFERARTHAKQIMDKPVSDRGSLAGMPVAIKDLSHVEGVLTTSGSPIFKDRVSDHSDLMVENIETADGVIYAKSNTPEFGAGANTFNEVFGATVTPWDTSKSCAGSSGGSAVALATGMAWLASGSDLGGSLRNPASFCSVVGMRCSPGRVTVGPGAGPFNDLSVNGPMARNVADVALFLDSMTAQNPADPLSLEKPATPFIAAVKAPKPPKKVAFSPDLGVTPVDPEVAEICAKAAQKFADLGVEVVEAAPDFTDLQHIFQTMRAIDFATKHQAKLSTYKELLKPEVIWNIERGLSLSSADVIRATTGRAQLYYNAVNFFKEYDLLLSPATVVPPYPIEDRFVAELGDHKFANYIEWCSIAYAITVVSLPALSLPAGFTASGLPVGLQVVGPPRGEADLLAGAHLLEGILELEQQVPINPRSPQ